jgi:hypothetical protein
MEEKRGRGEGHTMANQFLQRRWLDFRNGHSIYLAFLLTFINFILITYNFAIGKIPFLQDIIGNTFVFAVIFVAIYIPAAIGIGYWHRKRQYSVENEALLKENWVWAWISLYQIRLIEGKATPEESKLVRDYLEAILKAQKKDTLAGQSAESALTK